MRKTESLIMSPLTAAILLTCVIAGAVSINPPGLKARITPIGLQFASQRAKIEILRIAQLHRIPEQTGRYNIYIGRILWRAYGMYISGISIGYMNIYPHRSGLGITLSRTQISVHGFWEDEFNWMPFGDSGELDVTTGVYLSLRVYIGYDEKGKPTVHTEYSACSFSVEYVSLRLKGSGKYDWIYRKMKEKLENMIKDKLYEQVCSQLTMTVNSKADELLAYLKVLRPITKYAEIDLGLTSQPEFGSSVTTAHRGTVYETAHHREPPFNVSVLPYDSDETKMIFFWITDYVANSACYVLHHTQFFQYILTEDNIPAGADLNLNTSGFEMVFLIPQLSKLYPKRLMQINMTTTAPPKVTFGVSNVSVAMEGYASVYVVQPNRSLTYVFTLDATVKISAELGSYETHVTWDKASISFDVKLLKSAIHDFKIEDLRKKLKLALKMFIMPKVQQMGKVGISLPNLPLYGYAVGNLSISHGQNFLKIGTDIYYPDWLRLRDNPFESRSQLIPTFAALFD